MIFLEYLLFPKKSYFLTQGYGKNSYSHIYRKAIDVSAVGGSSKIYAPFTGTITRKFVSNPVIAYTCWFVSDNKVICSDGIARYAVIMLTHPNAIKDIKINQKYKQGDYMFDDGTTGGVAAHLDFELAVYDDKNKINSNWYQEPDGSYSLYNAVNPCDYMVIKDDTIVINEYYQNKIYNFKKISEVKHNDDNYFKAGGTYELLYEKYLRTSPNLGDNIALVENVDPATKKLLVDKTGKAKFKKGTVITSLKISIESNGRIWGSYGNCWYCMQNKDGQKNARKVF